VRVERERRRHAPGERPLADELQRVELRQLVALHSAAHDALEVLRHGVGRDAPDEQRIVLRAVGDQRQRRRVALVAGPAVREVRELRHRRQVDSRIVVRGRTRARSTSAETMPICSVTALRVPPPPAGPLV
jgi:hypothetical protein